MSFIRSTRPNYQVNQAKYGKQPPNHLLHPYLHFRRIITVNPKKPFKKCDGPVCVPAEVNKLLSPETVAALRNTTLRPSTSLPRIEVFMSLMLLIMNHPHQLIPLMRTNQTLSSLMMHLKTRMTQS